MPIIFYLESRKNKKGECPIRLSASIKFTRLQSTTGFSIDPDQWDKAKMRVKPHQTNSKKQSSAQINKWLNAVEGAILDFENSCTTRPELDDLKRIVARVGVEEDETLADSSRLSAVRCFEIFRDEERINNQWTPGSMKIWNAFEKHLKAVVNHHDLSFFNNDGINAFVTYLRIKAEMQENSVQKHYLNLRWFLNWAVRHGYASEREIGKVRPKFKLVEQPIIFLTKEELLKLYNYEIPASGTKVTLHTYEGQEYEKIVHNTSLEKTRDLFCFCCFTGLRYSDMANLKRTDVADNYIYITTQKTHDRLPINLNKFAKAILDKYKDNRFPGGLALPVITNQRMNVYIKDLCEICGFNQPISRVVYRAGKREETSEPKYQLIGTHAGRRTFICFALSSGIPPQVVMKWTGHSDYKAMKPYIDIAEKVKEEQMEVFEKGLDG